MNPIDDIRQVAMIFESQYRTANNKLIYIEMVFEGVVALNLRPYPDNSLSYLDSASLILKNETIFFCDGDVKSEDLMHDGTWIKSFGLRWRLID